MAKLYDEALQKLKQNIDRTDCLSMEDARILKDLGMSGQNVEDSNFQMIGVNFDRNLN